MFWKSLQKFNSITLVRLLLRVSVGQMRRSGEEFGMKANESKVRRPELFTVPRERVVTREGGRLASF